MPRLVKDRCVLGKDNRLAKILAVEFVVDLFCEPRSQFFKVYYFWGDRLGVVARAAQY